MPDLRIGVIGLGRRGEISAFAHRPGEGTRLVAAVDINDEALARFRQRYGPDVFLNRHCGALIENRLVDAVMICTPDYLHEEQALQFLDAGIAVYLEKPMALSIAGCDRILESARKNRTPLYVGHNMRYMSFVRKMKELIDAGAIGEVQTAWCRHFVGRGGDYYFKDWHAERDRSMGLLIQKASHDLDVLHWFCGGYARRVQAMGRLSVYDRVSARRLPSEPADTRPDDGHWPPLQQKGLNPLINVEDLSLVNMQLDNGVLVAYQQCHYSPDNWRNFTVIGTQGRIENLGDRTSRTVIRLWNRREDYNPGGDESWTVPTVEEAEFHHDERIISEFLHYVKDGSLLTLSPLDARYSVAAGYQATLSLRNGGVPLDVPPLADELTRYFKGGR